jgi:hypothetical protein
MSQSTELRLLLADNEAGATNAISIAAKGCDLIGDREFGRDDGRRGTRERYACGDRVTRETVSGGFDLQPSVAELDWLLERCMGDNITSYPAGPAVPGETLPQFYAYVDKGPQNYRYDKLVISRISFAIREGDFLQCRVDCIGSAEIQDVAWPSSPPAIACAAEFVAADAVFNLASTAYSFKSLDISIDNSIAGEQHENAINRTIFESEDFMVNLNLTTAVRTDTVALYRRAIAGDAGSVVINNGVATYTFTFANLKIPGRGPTVPATGEITQVLAMEARRTSGARTISVAKS